MHGETIKFKVVSNYTENTGRQCQIFIRPGDQAAGIRSPLR